MSSGDSTPFVFDTGPLSHFAKSGWLSILKAIIGGQPAIIPHAVVEELKLGAQSDPRIEPILDAKWIKHHVQDTDAEILAFARYEGILVSGHRNVGEASVLALAETLPAIAVIDDAAGRKAAAGAGIECRPTLRLLCDAISTGLLTLALVSALADDLLATEYRLPFKPGEFERWAAEQGILEASQTVLPLGL